MRRSLYNYLLPCLIVIWLVSFFSYLGWKPGFAYNAQRYFEILLVGCLLCFGATVPARFSFGRFWAYSVSLLLVFMCLVVGLAENTWLAIREGMQYLALFAAILAVGKARHVSGGDSFDRAASMGIVVFCFGCSLIVLEGLILSLSIGNVDQGIIFGAFVNIRIFAELQFLTLFLLPAAHQILSSRGWHIFIAITAILWWGLLLYTGTRSALIALPFALSILAFVARAKAVFWFRLVGLHFLGGIVVYLTIRGIVSAVLQQPFWGASGGMSFARASTSGRFDLWYDSWIHFLESPWFGQGPGAFACFTDELVAGPHNLFFQLLAEWGLFVTLISFALAFLVFWGMVVRLRLLASPSAVHLSLFATLVTAVAGSMMQGMINSPLQQMLIVLVFGWAWHVFSSAKFYLREGLPFERSQVIYTACLIAFLMTVLWGAKQDLDLQRELLISPDGTVNLSYGPRFWADGHDRCRDWHQRYYGEQTIEPE